MASRQYNTRSDFKNVEADLALYWRERPIIFCSRKVREKNYIYADKYILHGFWTLLHHIILLMVYESRLVDSDNAISHGTIQILEI